MADKAQRHVENLKELYHLWALSKGASVKPWMDLMGDTVRFRSLGAAAPSIEFSRDGIARADVELYFRDLARDWEMLEYEVEDVLADGDRVAVRSHCTWRNRHTGKVAETMKADFFRFEDGRIVEFFEFFDTAGAVAAATP